MHIESKSNMGCWEGAHGWGSKSLQYCNTTKDDVRMFLNPISNSSRLSLPSSADMIACTPSRLIPVAPTRRTRRAVRSWRSPENPRAIPPSFPARTTKGSLCISFPCNESTTNPVFSSSASRTSRIPIVVSRHAIHTDVKRRLRGSRLPSTNMGVVKKCELAPDR